jgi:hypothetical protein
MLAAALTRLMEAALYGIQALDPVSFVAAPAALVVVALIACSFPHDGPRPPIPRLHCDVNRPRRSAWNARAILAITPVRACVGPARGGLRAGDLELDVMHDV